MKTCVNLMSEAARFRVAARRRVKRWLACLVALTVALAAAASYQWLRYCEVVGDYEALEARYEPIRQLNAVNRSLRIETDALILHDKIPLDLSGRVPAESLLELVSRAAQSFDGRAYISRITILPGDDGDQAKLRSGLLSIEFVGQLDADVDPMLAVLNEAPFREVRVVSSEVATRDGEDRKIVSIECNY